MKLNRRGTAPIASILLLSWFLLSPPCPAAPAVGEPTTAPAAAAPPTRAAATPGAAAAPPGVAAPPTQAATAPAAAAAAPADAATEQSSPSIPQPSPLELLREAGFFIWPLAACSVLSVALIIERFVALRRKRIIPPDFLRGLRQVFANPKSDRQRAIDYCQRHDSPLSRMIGAGLRRLPRGPAAAEKAIEDAGGNETLKLRQNMRFLYSLGSVATLLGLIGTIAGMIKAFEVASVMGPGHAGKLSEGIYEAMVNTFAGLAVAIVVTIFYYYLSGRIENLVIEMNEAVNEFGKDAGFDASVEPEAAITATL